MKRAIKDLFFGFRNFSRGTLWIVPSGQDSSILPARVANTRAIWFVFPSHGAKQIIIAAYCPLNTLSDTKIRDLPPQAGRRVGSLH